MEAVAKGQVRGGRHVAAEVLPTRGPGAESLDGFQNIPVENAHDVAAAPCGEAGGSVYKVLQLHTQCRMYAWVAYSSRHGVGVRSTRLNQSDLLHLYGGYH